MPTERHYIITVLQPIEKANKQKTVRSHIQIIVHAAK